MDFTVSTQTFVVYSNAVEQLDLEELYSKIVLSDTIVGIKCGSNASGVSNANVNALNYLKCLTLSVRVPCSNQLKSLRKIPIGVKPLSIKVFKNGSIQVTGCKLDSHVKQCVDIVYRLLQLECVTKLYLVSVMINANFDVGFKINREKLCSYIESVCKINIPPITSGYMGTKFKVPLMKNVEELEIPCYSWTSDNGFKQLDSVGYLEYFANVPKKREKKFMACIGIFQNGKVLVSSVDRNAITAVSQWIWNTLKSAQPTIQVKIKQQMTFIRE